jgi:hypothetical protein
VVALNPSYRFVDGAHNSDPSSSFLLSFPATDEHLPISDPMVIYTMYTGFGGPEFWGALCGRSPRTPSSTALLLKASRNIIHDIHNKDINKGFSLSYILLLLGATSLRHCHFLIEISMIQSPYRSSTPLYPQELL